MVLVAYTRLICFLGSCSLSLIANPYSQNLYPKTKEKTILFCIFNQNLYQVPWLVRWCQMLCFILFRQSNWDSVLLLSQVRRKMSCPVLYTPEYFIYVNNLGVTAPYFQQACGMWHRSVSNTIGVLTVIS